MILGCFLAFFRLFWLSASLDVALELTGFGSLRKAVWLPTFGYQAQEPPSALRQSGNFHANDSHLGQNDFFSMIPCWLSDAIDHCCVARSERLLNRLLKRKSVERTGDGPVIKFLRWGWRPEANAGLLRNGIQKLPERERADVDYQRLVLRVALNNGAGRKRSGRFGYLAPGR